MATPVTRLPEMHAVAEDATAKLRQDLLCAFHILDLSGHPSGMGSHLTARLPGSETFLFHIHNYGFEEVTPDHIHEADFELNVLTGDVDINPTLHIHTRIYLARPEVTCIVHTHAKHVTALSAIGANLIPVSQGGARLHEDCNFFNEEDGVALGKAPGEAMARALDGRFALVLKNHGLLTVGRSIPEAVILANTMESEAEIQLMAMAAGKLDLCTEEGNQRTKEYLRSETMMGRGWAYHMRQLAARRPHVREL